MSVAGAYWRGDEKNKQTEEVDEKGNDDGVEEEEESDVEEIN